MFRRIEKLEVSETGRSKGDARSEGACRSGQFESGLAAAVGMNRCIARAGGEFTFAPTANERHISARDSADAIDDSIVQAKETQAAVARIEVRCQIVEGCEHCEVPTGNAAIFYACGFQDAIKHRLSGHSCQERSPVVESELAESHD
jgi:hypothetical protein